MFEDTLINEIAGMTSELVKIRKAIETQTKVLSTLITKWHGDDNIHHREENDLIKKIANVGGGKNG